MTTPSLLDQLEAMRLGTSYRMPISVRGLEIYVRPLTIDETVEVATQVAEELQNLPAISRNSLNEHTMLAKHTLIRASTSSPDKLDPKINEQVIGRMTPDELTHMFKQYVAVCDKVNPALESLPQRDIELLVEGVKKNPSALTELSFLELANVCRHLLTDSPMDK